MLLNWDREAMLDIPGPGGNIWSNTLSEVSHFPATPNFCYLVFDWLRTWARLKAKYLHLVCLITSFSILLFITAEIDCIIMHTWQLPNEYLSQMSHVYSSHLIPCCNIRWNIFLSVTFYYFIFMISDIWNWKYKERKCSTLFKHLVKLFTAFRCQRYTFLTSALCPDWWLNLDLQMIS